MSLVRAMTVVVPGIGVEDLPSMGLAPYQQVVKDFAPQGAHHPLAVRVHSGSPRRSLHNLDVVGREDRVEGFGVSRVPVAKQET